MKQIKIHLPLFWKFTIAIILVVAIFGSLNYYFINKALQNLSNTEINRHGQSISKSISERSIEPILFDDISYLDKMVSDHKKIDPGIAYIIIFDKNNDLIAHSFENTIPQEIINHSRSDWTYNYKKENHNNYEYEESIKIIKQNMLKLSELLRTKNIDLSIAVYPWPNTLKNDIEK